MIRGSSFDSGHGSNNTSFSNLSNRMSRMKRLPDAGMANPTGTLSLASVTMFGIGNTIGAGIFALSGVAAQYAGPSLFISFLIAGGIAMMTALMYETVQRARKH